MDLRNDSAYRMPLNLYVWTRLNERVQQRPNRILNLNKVEWGGRYLHNAIRSNLADCPAKLEDLPRKARDLGQNLWWLGKAGTAVRSATDGRDEANIVTTNDPSRMSQKAKERGRPVTAREPRALSTTASRTQSKTLSVAPSVTASSISTSRPRSALGSGRKVKFDGDESDEETDYEVGNNWVTSVRTISYHSDQC